MSHQALTTTDLRRVSALADVDLRTIRDYLSGRRRSISATAKAIEGALRDIGRADLVRATSIRGAA